MQKDKAAVELLSYNEELVLSRNWLGFTPYELALLLGNYELFGLSEQKKIKVQKKGENALIEMSQAEYEAFFKVKYLLSPCFETLDILEKLIKNCPFLLKSTFVGDEHRTLGASLRSRLFTGYTEDVSIRYVSDYVGYGLFAEKLIAKEQYIGQYTGLVQSTHRFSYERNDYSIHIPTRFFSLCYFIMNGAKMGGEMRFANHSNRPNMKPFCLIDRSLVHIGFFALRDIEPGEELTFSYGKIGG